MSDKRLDPCARRHHGLVTVADFIAAGRDRRTWYRWVASGRLILVHPGVARLPGTAVTKAMSIAAAVLAAGPGAMASHRSAAYLAGVPRPDDDPIDVMIPRGRRLVHLHGVVIHRPRDPIDLRSIVVRGIDSTVPLRWLVDLGAVDPGGVSDAIGHVATSGMASAKALRWAGRAHSRQGRHGIVVFRESVEEWLIGSRLPDSVLEKAMNELRATYRLPSMTFHAIVLGYEVDFLIDGTRIVLECDSWEFHDKARDSFERDRKKKADLVAGGYVVVPFTYRNVRRRPAWVAATVLRAVATWSGSKVLGAV